MHIEESLRLPRPNLAALRVNAGVLRACLQRDAPSEAQPGSLTLKMVKGPERGRWFLKATSQRWESAMYR